MIKMKKNKINPDNLTFFVYILAFLCKNLNSVFLIEELSFKSPQIKVAKPFFPFFFWLTAASSQAFIILCQEWR